VRLAELDPVRVRIDVNRLVFRPVAERQNVGRVVGGLAHLSPLASWAFARVLEASMACRHKMSMPHKQLFLRQGRGCRKGGCLVGLFAALGASLGKALVSL